MHAQLRFGASRHAHIGNQVHDSRGLLRPILAHLTQDLLTGKAPDALRTCEDGRGGHCCRSRGAGGVPFLRLQMRHRERHGEAIQVFE